MGAEAAGRYRRNDAERRDQRLSWNRPDQAFFASGACHVLAWTCREIHPEVVIGIGAVRFTGERQVFHVFATWQGWAFDYSGWNREADLLRVNQDFEDRPLDRVEITTDLPTFCSEHHSRMPDQYWADPRPRARAYAAAFAPPGREGLPRHAT